MLGWYFFFFLSLLFYENGTECVGILFEFADTLTHGFQFWRDAIVWEISKMNCACALHTATYYTHQTHIISHDCKYILYNKRLLTISWLCNSILLYDFLRKKKQNFLSLFHLDSWCFIAFEVHKFRNLRKTKNGCHTKHEQTINTFGYASVFFNAIPA